MTDTRKDKRAPISLKVRFKSATVDEFIEQYSKDISKGGIFIKSNKNSPPMPIGTLLKFEFQLKDESKLIQGVGRVVWKRELEGSSDNDPAGMGIKFIKMDPESKGLVDQIVAGRGEAPGQFEAGGGGAHVEPEAAAGAGATASGEGKRPIRSQKATMQFFPSTTPQNELPKPEDRTQVRHASEFLASALSSAGVDEATTGEADKKAEEARERSAEIERERDAQAKRARDEEDKKARAERERNEREKAEAEEKAAAAATKEKKDADKPAAAAAAAAADAPKKKATSDRPPADKAAAKDDKKAAAAAATPAKKAEPKVAAAVPAPAPEPSSNMMPIFAAVLVVVALGGWYLFGRGDGTTDDSELPPPPPSTTVEAPPPTTEVEAPPETAVEAPPETVVAEEGTTEEGTTEEGTTAEVVEPPTPAVTHDIRVDSTPAAATIVVDGESRGVAPQTLTLAEGEHTIEARLAGYRTATQTVRSASGVRPVRITLTSLPWIIHVTSTPPGAHVRVGGRMVTTPADAAVGRVTAPVIATASLAGYLDATQRIEASAFTQGEDSMTADLAIALTPRPAAPPPTTTIRRPPPTTGTTAPPPPSTTTTTPPPSTTTAEPPPTEVHHEPPPPTEVHHEPPPPTEVHHEPPPATEAPPDNPF